MGSPLNINLLIPFKDNKGGRLDLYRIELDRFKADLSSRSEELKEELDSLLGDSCEITIASRSDGHTKKYYWRFKSSKKDRKFNRLNSEAIMDYINTLDSERKLRLKEMEVELIYINANLKLLKGMLDAIDQSNKELSQLAMVNFQKT